MKNKLLLAASFLALTCALQPAPAHATLSWPGEPYCVKPAFVAGNVSPNLLLMIDNSASMYDLQYVDEGKKHCSNSSTSCTSNADCSNGGTCSVFDRRPFYCYDQTFDSTKNYYGYFNKDKFYYYYKKQDDGTGDEFRPVAGSTLAQALSVVSCGANGTNINKTFPGQMCLEYTTGKALVAFVAKGNYLNWLTASKLDAEKQTLTGGKFDGSYFIPESRGCVGQAFVKDQNTADFINFADGTPDPNASLQVTYTITGPSNEYNSTAPSNGGQTYINLFGGATFNYGNCQDAINALATGGNADIKQTVDSCLASTAPATGTCQNVPAALRPFAACTTNSDCNLNKSIDTNAYVCQTYLGKTCTGLADTTSCKIAARNSCTVDPTIACGVDSDCNVAVAATPGHCSTDKSMYTPAPGSKDDVPAISCTTDADCKFKSTGTNFVGKINSCVGYTAASTSYKGPCVVTAAQDYGPCVANYVGDCQLTAQGAATKTKVSFQQSMQECWKIRGQTYTANSNPPYGFTNMQTVLQQCPDIYASYKTCHNDHMKQCTSSADCGGAACDSGPDAIGAGNPALLCGASYEGPFFTKNASGNWVVTAAGSADSYLAMKEAQYRFCGDMASPPVTDPTDSPSDTAITENMPAILSGIGVEAQLGAPIQKMRVKIGATSCTTVSDCGTTNPERSFTCTSGTCQPIGLVQEFSDKIRLGVATFNPFGSASETALAGVKDAKVCYVGAGSTQVTPVQACVQNIDCGTGNRCDVASGNANLDGGAIIYPVGKGVCATMTGTACTTNAQCSGTNTCLNGFCGSKSTDVCTTVSNCSGSSQACVRDTAGAHTASDTLVGKIDGIRAASWTPLAETLYNVLGYFAAIPQTGGSLKSRVTGAATGLTGLRINAIDTTSVTNAVDFNEVLHPSEYRCQQNYVLLVSDGSSTADRNTTVGNLASLYAAQAGTTAGACTVPSGSVDHGGTSNLPVISWLGRHQNLASFSTTAVTPVHCSGHTSTTCTRDSDCPSGETCQNGTYPRDYFTTYVVLNGESTGTSDVCSAEMLLGKTASNGGTTLEMAKDPVEQRDKLSTIFQTIAAKASSGTAASILSNSEGSGANILQAVFFPKKVFENQSYSDWIGEMQNLWYYVDPQISRSTIREDTNADKQLDLIADKVVSFRFDTTDNTTYAFASQDTNGDGIGDTTEVKEDTDLVKSIWRAGKQLWSRNLSSSPRKIFTSINGTSLIDFSSDTFRGTANSDNSATLAPYLNVSAGEATRLIDYVHGVDQNDLEGFASYRSRKVQIKDQATNTISSPREWRLGDIISSTPRIQSTGKLNTYNVAAPSGYGDASYTSFINSYQYKHRGMVYVGGNDGMLHSFKLGLLDVTASSTHKATLTGSALGEEQWAYIPKQVLPFLKYYGDPKYNHLYYVDGSTVLFDASIGTTTLNTDTNTNICPDGATYYDCPKQASVVNATNELDPTRNTWRTVLIGGMGIGGASTKTCASGAECVQTPVAEDPSDTSKALGYSTYFALDVSDPEAPSLMWEFNDPAMGFATTGPAVVRVGPRDKNGHWYAVFGSGPTGKIDTNNNQFKGQSNQTLKFFIVDLRTGTLLRTIDTGIENAFAGSMLGGPIDADRWDSYANGHYQDDAILVGYTKKNTTTNTWSDGGVIRITTKESSTVNNWGWSHVIEDTGPVVTAISRLQDRKNKRLWLYFGSGRYYYRAGTDIDDFSNQRSIYGIKDPCYNTNALPGNVYDKNCTATVTSGVTDQSEEITSVGAGGWKIDMDLSSGNFGAERVVTDAVALTNGTVFLTSFQPTADPCGFGGNSFLWALGYDTGDRPSDAALAGKALIQLSTGEFKEVDLAQAFGSGAARLNRRSGVPMTGKPPADAFPIVSKSGNKPVKKIMHIQER